MIDAVAVVVPARDEALLLPGCLAALGRSLARLPATIERAVVVVADRCTDETAVIARESGARVVPNSQPTAIGAVRDLGCRAALDALPAHDPAKVLLLNTDADTEVSPAWLRRHLDRACRGWHASAGPARLSQPFPGSGDAAARYRGIVARDEPNVYGANLAVRADAYRAVGGFGPIATGEDHALWQRLGEAGFHRCHEPAAVVFTSPRRQGRAPGGLADLLRELTGS
ncbi:glycosyltransferase family 2 protein [Amycolatopsis sp. FDAARGOS 1241]|uniref:glycosyltransferase n=1 Tax=Amycolatopsis sp. FDAARGOS 1241 TaxID=2778070 RepID=UPI00194F04E2|nr:glycosyltransferase family 2 protein [Amycolatopsis sp. FDAARGOS 1241]QRP49731.1 glycosyltransferase family 2 protein [Amycolatopsis sp. FDAARGOS 1241]